MKRRWLLFLLLLGVPTAAVAQAEATVTSGGFLERLDAIFTKLVEYLAVVLFFEIGDVPLIVLWLIAGAIFFTVRMGFINVRAFKHAFYVIAGHYDDPDEEGEVTHFQALAAALSATVGLGNIAGVAIAITVGGPGAMVWMTLGGLFGMTSKFVECTLAQKYRISLPNGHVAGGPMYYLSQGLAERGLRPLGQVLSVVFSILCIGAAFGGGNMFQANQSHEALKTAAEEFAFRGLVEQLDWIYGLVLAALVALVIIGGIRRIGTVAASLVPSMCIIYVLSAAWILLVNIDQVPSAVVTIVTEAFNPQAVEGGIIGIIVTGIQRSGFSNEAGIGSAAIAHAAARTHEPVREGVVALLEPFIDTVVICNMTAIVIVITGVYQDAEGLSGVKTTSAAFETVIGWFPVVLGLAILLFAFSTMISWSYYGERAWTFLFGQGTSIVYRVLFVACVFIGSVVNLGAVLDFADMMLLSMAFPNMLGGFILSGQVAADLKNYMDRLRDGTMPVFK